MTQKPTVLQNVALFLAKVQTGRGVPAIPDAVNDAFLVGDVDISLEASELERQVFNPSLSNVQNGVGRKVVTVTCTHEIKGSGDVGVTRPKLGSLLRGSAMQELLVTAGAATQIEDPIRFGSTVGVTTTWAKTTAPTSIYGSYLVECVVGGASGAAELQVFRWNSGEPDATVLPSNRHEAKTNYSADTTFVLDNSDLTSLTYTVGGTVTAGDDLYAVVGGNVYKHTVTSAEAGGGSPSDTVAAAIGALIDADARIAASVTGSVITVTFASNSAPVVTTSGSTAIDLGDSGGQITPTWTGDLVKGQQWIVVTYELGYNYRPVSSDSLVELLTIYVYKDGKLHIVTDCIGTVTFNGESGNLGTASFEYQGNYTDPVEEPTPLDAVYEQTQPQQVELAQLNLFGDPDFCAQSFTYTLGNEITPLECMNAADGYEGAIITARTPTASMNPNDSLEVYTGFFSTFAQGLPMPVHNRVGSVSGNMVRFYGNRAGFSGLTYGERDGRTTDEISLNLNAVSSFGDDELIVAFP